MTGIVDPRVLSGQILPYKEEIERYRKTKVEPLHDLYRLYDHASFKDFHQRKGQVLHSSEFIRRLQKLNPQIIVQRQVNFESDWGVYADLSGKLVYLSGFPKGWLTEFSYALVDERDLPTEERRGWRTVLLKLMARGILAWKQVVQTFGNSEGFNSERWMIYTAPYRNNDSLQVVGRNLSNEFAVY